MAQAKIIDLATYPGKFISLLQLARYTGLSRRTLYHHVDKGALPIVKLGGTIRVRKRDALVYCGEDRQQLRA